MTNTFNSTDSIIARIAADLADARAELAGQIAALPDDQFDLRPDEEAWSVGEILSHLHLVENSIGRLLASLLERRSGRGEEKGDEGTGNGTIDYAGIVLPPDPVQASERAIPQRGVPRKEGLKALATSREALMQMLNNSAPFDMSRATFPHPILGDLNFYEWFGFVAAHERRHTGQIERTIGQINKAANNPA